MEEKLHQRLTEEELDGVAGGLSEILIGGVLGVVAGGSILKDVGGFAGEDQPAEIQLDEDKNQEHQDIIKADILQSDLTWL
jgi:hypothetical protein